MPATEAARKHVADARSRSRRQPASRGHQLRGHPAGRQRVEAKSGGDASDGHDRAHRPRDELHAAEKGRSCRPCSTALKMRSGNVTTNATTTIASGHRSGAHSAGRSHTTRPPMSATGGTCQSDEPRGLADDGLQLGVIAIGSPSRDGDVARHQRTMPEIHQGQIDEYLRAQQPQPVVVRSQLAQQVRREPQPTTIVTIACGDSRAQAADEAPQAAHVIRQASSSAGSRRSARARIAPKSAPVTAQNTMPSCVLKTGPVRAQTDDGELQAQDGGGEVLQRARSSARRPTRYAETHGRDEGAAVEQPHRDAAVEQPAGRLNLDVNRRRLPHRRIAEIHLHHSPATEPGAERKLEQQLAQGVAEEQPTLLAETCGRHRLGQAREPVYDGVAANGDRPDERRRRRARRRRRRAQPASQGAALPQTERRQTRATLAAATTVSDRTWVR